MSDSDDTPCFVYVITIDDLELTKVGISTNPRSRLDQLSTGSPHKMRIAHAFKMPDKEIARTLEAGFHHVLRGSRANGEWFKIPAKEATDAMCINIVTMLRSQMNFAVEELFLAFHAIGMPQGYEGIVATLLDRPKNEEAVH